MFTPAAEVAILAHHWPGNVRELRNVLERGCVLSRTGEIGPEVLGLAARAPSPAILDAMEPSLDAEAPTGWIQVPAVRDDLPFREAKAQLLDEFERRFIRKCLERSGGNVSRAAIALDMHRQSLQQKLKDLGIARGGDES
jgi:DNA-binding NtrC family response regulator